MKAGVANARKASSGDFSCGSGRKFQCHKASMATRVWRMLRTLALNNVLVEVESKLEYLRKLVKMCRPQLVRRRSPTALAM